MTRDFATTPTPGDLVRYGARVWKVGALRSHLGERDVFLVSLDGGVVARVPAELVTIVKKAGETPS